MRAKSDEERGTLRNGWPRIDVFDVLDAKRAQEISSMILGPSSPSIELRSRDILRPETSFGWGDRSV